MTSFRVTLLSHHDTKAWYKNNIENIEIIE